MAAYAALVSVMHTIQQIENHPSPPISLDKTQVESLTEKVNFLQEFLEGYSHVADNTKKADKLESRIADAAYAVEDVIECHIVGRIRASHSEEITSGVSSGVRNEKMSFLNLFKCFRGPRKAANDNEDWGMDLFVGPGSRSRDFEDSCAGVNDIISTDLYEALQKAIADIDSLKKEAMETKEKKGVEDDQQQRYSTVHPVPLGSSSNVQMVGFDDALLEIMDKLTGGQPDRRVIPIVGMGGMGKTTLTRNVYENPLVKEHFDICGWATISQCYDAREVIREILCEESKDSSENELGEMLYKQLWGRRYLIVMDDMWSIEAWDEVGRFFPDNENGSRVVVTTRLSNLAFQLTDSYHFEMKFLDQHASWNLFCKILFGDKGCPLELEKIGKKIANNCRGLPLSIVVTGGFLVKSRYSTEYWGYIAKNLNSLVNSEDDERCLKILYMSYKQLPIHLKPCFLYMGVFPEDRTIRAKMLRRLWVAEGFLKPISGKCLEEVAKVYLEELVSRNLVQAETHFGKIKFCKIHDLLRDLCLREAERERFYINVTWEQSFRGKNTQRRIVIHGRVGKEVTHNLQSMSFARSVICPHGIVPLSCNFMLLRIVNRSEVTFYTDPPFHLQDHMFQLLNIRHIHISTYRITKFPRAINLLWNLQTLIIDFHSPFSAPSEIWLMPQLRHVKFVRGLYLPDPPSSNIVLRNLRSLSTIHNFQCGEAVMKRIPNVKKLSVRYEKDGDSSSRQYDCLYNIYCLHKLESFCYFSDQYPSVFKLKRLSLPHSLKKLSLEANLVRWDVVMEKVGSLPRLEVLILKENYFLGYVWKTVEGQFRSLKFLQIMGWIDLNYWETDSTHFPCLEKLVLYDLHRLKEIPSSIGDIPTLRSIELHGCWFPVIFSAKKILDEQEELLGEVTLQVRVFVSTGKEATRLKSFISPNFQVQ